MKFLGWFHDGLHDVSLEPTAVCVESQFDVKEICFWSHMLSYTVWLQPFTALGFGRRWLRKPKISGPVHLTYF